MLLACAGRRSTHGLLRYLKPGFTRDMNTRSYKDAVDALNNLQTNASVIEAIRKSKRSMNSQAIPEMLEWLRRAGYCAKDFDSLNAIHIAGTKGKGSTAAFVSSILNQYRLSGHGNIRKVGLYTSPHLRFVRERIQLNGIPIDEEAFAESFFEVWDRLEEARTIGPGPTGADRPVYFRYLTIMALHTYFKENVDAAVIECGIGGEHDSTNILQSPAVTGISSLGIDHVAVLGSTIGQIAWHKAGIMKPGRPAFTVAQPKEAMDVLHARAKEKGVDLTVVGIHPQIASGELRLGLNGDFQKLNASLAVQLAASYLKGRGMSDLRTDILPTQFIKGLEEVKWGGRCEIRQEPCLTWYIDGAHTLESIQVTAKWYASTVSVDSKPPRILLFNQQTRDGAALLEELHKILVSNDLDFSHVVFCTNLTYKSTGYRPDLVSVNVDKDTVESLSVQNAFVDAWHKLAGQSTTEVLVRPTIEEAVQHCRTIASKWKQQNTVASGKPSVLATGSIHLIGGVIDVLEEIPT